MPRMAQHLERPELFEKGVQGGAKKDWLEVGEGAAITPSSFPTF